MANPLRNAMVYFGLADEDEQFDEQYDQQPAERPAATGATRAHQDTGAFRDEDARPAPVTPITRASKPAPIPAPGAMNEILTVRPKAYDQDAQMIAENFRNGIPVIMNLSKMEESDARRLIDFASGLTQGLCGRIERVTNRVVLLSPEHVAVHSEERPAAAEQEPSFFS